MQIAGGRAQTGRRQARLRSLLLFLPVAALLRAPGFAAAVLDPDEGLYLVQAQAWLEGGWPFVAVFDMHPLGAPALLALALALIADPILGARWLGVVAVAATAALLHGIALRLGGDRATGLAVGLLYLAASTMPGGLATNTEILFAPFVVLVARLLLGQAQAPRLGVVLAAGLAAGAAITIKQVTAIESAALWLTMIVAAWRAGGIGARGIAASAGVFALGAGAPMLALGFGYWVAGQGEAWWQGNIASAVAYLDAPITTPGARAFAALVLPWLAGLVVLAGGVALRDAPARAAVRWLWPWLAAAVVAVVAPQKFFNHYALILAPPLSLLAAFGLVAVLRQAVVPPFRRGGFVVLLGLAMAVPVAGMLLPKLATGIGLRGTDPVREVARTAMANLAPGEALFVANWHVVTYALAGVRPPTRFPFPLHLIGVAPRLAGVDTAMELDRVLALPPGVIVVDPGRWWGLRPDARAAVEAALARDYRLAATIQDGPGPVEVWRRR
jgi:hypothetical protein